MSRINIVLTIIPTLYEGYIVSVRRMVMENRPVDPGSIQGSHRPISFIRIKRRTRAIDFFGKLSINNHIVGLVHKNHIIRTCLMCHAACKVEFQPFKRSYSQLTFFNFLLKKKSNSDGEGLGLLFVACLITPTQTSLVHAMNGLRAMLLDCNPSGNEDCEQ